MTPIRLLAVEDIPDFGFRWQGRPPMGIAFAVEPTYPSLC